MADLDFSARRERLLERIGSGVAVVASAPELSRGGDAEVPFRQDADFYYLTGFQEPDAVAVLTPHDPWRFVLFVRPRDPAREAWNGPRAGVEGAIERFGADAAFPIDELEDRLGDLVKPADRLYYRIGDQAALDERVLGLVAAARAARPRTGRGPVSIEDITFILSGMRRTKDLVEVERMREAAAVGVAGHRAAMAAARAGMGEWELEAVLEYTFRSMGATGPAFPSIVGSGGNATILHYTANDGRTREGDLVLQDAGAEMGMYCSDVTRTFPVSGRFTAPQREIYDLVLTAQEAAIAAIRPGKPFDGVHDSALHELVEGLLRLGLLSGSVESVLETGDHRQFFMHKTSHWLGLDVHDAGQYVEGGDPVLLKPGMVLTVEPGLYFPAAAQVPERYRGIGVRIEDDVLITPDGAELLTRGVPVSPDEIEALVGSEAE